MSHSIDFFAVVGRKEEEKLNCTKVSSLWDENQKSSLVDVWNDAITDIALVTEYNRDSIDDSWTIITESTDGVEFMDLDVKICLAYRRRRESKKIDHISQIQLVSGEQVDLIPRGFEVLGGAVCGYTDISLADPYYLSVKRSQPTPQANIDGYPIIDDICFVLESEGEEPPASDYIMLDKCLLKKNSNHKIYLAYHVRKPQGLCNISYEAATVDRYPQQDYKDMELPALELPVFVFPHGLQLLESKKDLYPLPVFFTFVFTDAKGDHYYAACLQFYELVSESILINTCEEIYKNQPSNLGESGSENEVEETQTPTPAISQETFKEYCTLPSHKSVYAPKVICVLSKRPFYRAMRRYLRQLYSLSLSVTSCPIEYFISSVVGQIPLPIPGGRAFHLLQDASLVSSTSKTMGPIKFESTDPYFFPDLDLDFSAPFRCLTVDNILAIFALLLREAKVVFICKSNTLLTEAMESLKSLLFPLEWSSTFISRLPDPLNGLLEAPGGFMIGIHDVGNDAHAGVNSQDRYYTEMPTEKGLMSKLNKTNQPIVTSRRWDITLIPGTYVVDLSANLISQYNGKYEEIMNENKIKQLIKTYLPSVPMRRLRQSLVSLVDDYGLCPSNAKNMDEYDSAFEIPSIDANMEVGLDDGSSGGKVYKKITTFPTLGLRDHFLVFMTEIIGDYYNYIRPPNQNLAVDSYRTLKEEFAMVEYLANANIFSPGLSSGTASSDNKTLRLLLGELTGTQMFAVLLQQRSELNSYHIVFFEQAVRLFNELKMNYVTHRGVKEHVASSGTASPMSPKTASEHGRELTISSPTRALLFNSSYSTFDLPCCLYKLVAAYRHHFLKQESIDQESFGSSALDSLKSPEKDKVVASSTLIHTLVPIVYELDLHAAEISVMDYNDSSHEAPVDGPDPDVTALPCAGRTEIHARGTSSAHISVRVAELQLSNSSMGPLLIPGPGSLDHIPCGSFIKKSRQERQRILEETHPSDWKSILEDEFHFYVVEDDNSADTCVKFCYRHGWPTLNQTFLAECKEKSVHPVVKGIAYQRVFSIEHVLPEARMMCRSHVDRFYFRIAGRLLCPLQQELYYQHHYSGTKTNVSKAGSFNRNAGKTPAMGEFAKNTVCMFLDTVHGAILMLCLRMLNGIKPMGDMLQILGLLSQLETMQLIDYVSESIWRSIFVACAHCGGDFMRKVACIVYETMIDCSIPLSTHTFGQYQRCITAVKVNYQEEVALSTFDNYIYLEEIGATWLTQRVVLSDLVHSLSDRRNSKADNNTPNSMANSNNSPTKGMFGGLFGSSSNTPKYVADTISPLNTASRDQMTSQVNNVGGRRKSVRAAGATDVVTNQLGLVRVNQSGFVSLLAPPRFHVMSGYLYRPPRTNPVHNSNSGVVPFETFDLEGNDLEFDIGSGLENNSDTADLDLGLVIRNRYTKIVNDFQSNVVHNVGAEKDMSMRSSSASSSDVTRRRSATAGSNSSTGDRGTWSSRFAKAMSFGKKRSETEGTVEESRPSNMESKQRGVSISLLDDMEAEGQACRSPSQAVVEEAIASEFSDEEDEEEGIDDDADEDASMGAGTDVADAPLVAVETASVGTTSPLPSNMFGSGAGASHILGLVDDAQDVLVAELHKADKHCALGVYSRTACKSCGFANLDEEILMAWSGASDCTMPALNVDGSSEDIKTAHVVVCSNCRHEIKPTLCVDCYDSGSSSPDTPVWSLPCDSEAIDVSAISSISLLSPYGVRFALEDVVMQCGHEVACSAEWLVSHAPDLFWSMIWFSLKCGTPLPFTYNSSTSCRTESSGVAGIKLESCEVLTNSGSPVKARDIAQIVCGGDVFVCWRRISVGCKIKKYFQSLLGDSEYCVPTRVEINSISELLPSIAPADLIEIEKICEFIKEGTAGGLRNALLLICNLKTLLISLMMDFNYYAAPADLDEVLKLLDNPTLMARSLYIAMLTLVTVYRPDNKLIAHHRRGSMADGGNSSSNHLVYEGTIVDVLNKKFPFDEFISRAVREHMSISDIEKLQTTTEDIHQQCTMPRSVQSFRIALGQLA